MGRNDDDAYLRRRYREATEDVLDAYELHLDESTAWRQLDDALDVLHDVLNRDREALVTRDNAVTNV